MSLHTLAAPRAPRAAFGKIVLNEARLAWRQPAGIVVSIGLSLLLLVIFGSIPVFQQTSSRLGGLSAFEVYIPILISFSIGVLALAYLPGPLVSYREQGILRRLSTTPVPAFWVLAAQFVVQACLMLIAVFLLIGVSVAGYGAIAPRNPGGLVLALVLSIAALFAIGLSIAAAARTSGAARAIMALAFYPLMFFSGLYVPDADPAARVREHQPLHPARRDRAGDPGLDARPVPPGAAAAGDGGVRDRVRVPGQAFLPMGVTQMDSFTGKLAVVTGGGSGMGRELVRQLAAQGCSVAACDWHPDAVAETAALARADTGSGVLVTSHACDVSDEAQVLRFRDELLGQHARDHVDLVFANAGIGGGNSFVNDTREEWERTFAVDFYGVYYCARAFLPLLIASGDGVLVNTSSVNGLWAALGPGIPATAYGAAKFAVKGFTEALIEDLRSNAPQVRVAVVIPGHVGTDIIPNTLRAHGTGPERMSEAELEGTRDALVGAGVLAEGASAEDARRLLLQGIKDFKDKAPVSAAQAATIILDGVRSGAWRILIGDDARMIDAAVRAKPEASYDYTELFSEVPAP